MSDIMENKTFRIFFQSRNPVKIMKKSEAVVIDMEDQSFKESDVIEDMILRFPHLAEYVFNELATKDLKTCLNVSRQWCHFIHNERFPWKSESFAKTRNFH